MFWVGYLTSACHQWPSLSMTILPALPPLYSSACRGLQWNSHAIVSNNSFNALAEPISTISPTGHSIALISYLLPMVKYPTIHDSEECQNRQLGCSYHHSMMLRLPLMQTSNDSPWLPLEETACQQCLFGSILPPKNDLVTSRAKNTLSLGWLQQPQPIALLTQPPHHLIIQHPNNLFCYLLCWNIACRPSGWHHL